MNHNEGGQLLPGLLRRRRATTATTTAATAPLRGPFGLGAPTTLGTTAGDSCAPTAVSFLVVAAREVLHYLGEECIRVESQGITPGHT